MRLFLTILALSAMSASALPAYMRFQGVSAQNVPGEWKAPGPGDSRSPCPMLNTLANHGVLPRDGKGITKEMLGDAFVNVLGCSTVFGRGFAKVAYNKFVKDPNGKLSLDMLTLPFENGGIEHFASLSRPDVPRPVPKGAKAPPPDVPRIEGELKAIGKLNDADKISMNDLAKIRVGLEKNNPPAVHKFIAAAEICLLQGIAKGKDGMTVGRYRSFLEKEQFPADWSKPNYIMGFGVTNMVSCLARLGVNKLVGVKRADIPYLNTE